MARNWKTSIKRAKEPVCGKSWKGKRNPEMVPARPLDADVGSAGVSCGLRLYVVDTAAIYLRTPATAANHPGTPGVEIRGSAHPVRQRSGTRQSVCMMDTRSARRYAYHAL